MKFKYKTSVKHDDCFVALLSYTTVKPPPAVKQITQHFNTIWSLINV